MLFGTNPGHRYAIHRCCFARLSKSLSVLCFSSVNAFQLLSKSHQFLARSTLNKAVPCLVQSTPCLVQAIPTHLEALLIHLKSFKAPPLQIVTNLFPSISTLCYSVPRPIESTPKAHRSFSESSQNYSTPLLCDSHPFDSHPGPFQSILFRHCSHHALLFKSYSIHVLAFSHPLMPRASYQSQSTSSPSISFHRQVR